MLSGWGRLACSSTPVSGTTGRLKITVMLAVGSVSTLPSDGCVAATDSGPDACSVTCCEEFSCVPSSAAADTRTNW